MTPAFRSLDDAELLDWLRLIRSEGIGPRTFYGLLDRFGSARAALEALPRLAGRSAGRAVALASLRDVEGELAAARRGGIRFVAACEAAYPASLRVIDSAPPLIAVKGRLDVLQRSMVAIVGSRNASAAGLVVTERLAQGLGSAGHVVVSGLARGIDAKAHQASLATGTVAVLAGGHDRIYPSEHLGLATRIAEAGAVLSEMPLAWEPRGRDFPRRNRIVSGLAFGVVVVEAARRSGSLITARFANEQGREIFAVPGSPLDPRAEGTNDLLRQGATLCTGAGDVLDVLQPMTEPRIPRAFAEPLRRGGTTELFWDELDLGGPQPRQAPSDPDSPRDSPAARSDAAAATDPKERLADLIGAVPVTVDDLVRVSAIPARVVQSALMELEMEGRIGRRDGNAVSRVVAG